MQNKNRHLAAILFTDIVGYTALMQQNERLAVAMVKRYLSVLQTTVKNHSGKILNDYGDGSLCSFTSATEAVNCATELQQELQKEPAVPLRIGLHIGEIFFEDKKVFGDGVNVASRIESLGQANTILFSGEINNKIKNNPGFKSVSLGYFEFKNVDDPVEVFALMSEGLVVPKKEEMSGKLKESKKILSIKKVLILAGIIVLVFSVIFFYKKLSGNNNIDSKEKTIALLPFKNISFNKEENEPFCVGVALELQKKLEWMGELTMISPQSVEKFRDSKLSIADIAGELGGIKYILIGTVQRDKNKVKVFASLVDTESGKELWSDNFPGEMEDIFSLQENIAQQIASALQVKITPEENRRISRIPSKNTKTIDAYNDALTSYTKLVSAVHPLYWDSLPSNPQLYSIYLETLALCDNTIKTDPLMAEAYVLKGQTYHYNFNDWMSSKFQYELIRDSIKFLANKALQIDNASADAYILKASVTSRDSIITYLEKAFTTNPNSFDVNAALGHFYSWSFDAEKAIRYCKKAIRLNPISYRIPYVYMDLGSAYRNFGNFEKAELYDKKAIELSTNSMIAIETTRGLTITYLHWGKADSVFKYANEYSNQTANKEINALYEIAEAWCNIKNDCGKAAELYAELWKRYPQHINLNRWAVALIKSGKTEEGKEKLKADIKWFQQAGDTLSYDYAGDLALNGDKEAALKILRHWTWNWGSLYLIQHDKLFDNIRNETAFKEIIQKALAEKAKLREKIRKMEERGEL